MNFSFTAEQEHFRNRCGACAKACPEAAEIDEKGGNSREVIGDFGAAGLFGV
jgi:ferredoxin